MLGCGLVIMIGHMQLQTEVLLQFWLLRVIHKNLVLLQCELDLQIQALTLYSLALYSLAAAGDAKGIRNTKNKVIKKLLVFII